MGWVLTLLPQQPAVLVSIVGSLGVGYNHKVQEFCILADKNVLCSWANFLFSDVQSYAGQFASEGNSVKISFQADILERSSRKQFKQAWLNIIREAYHWL